MKTFVTSDLHFFHKNIIQYAKRPFDSVEEMNSTLVNNWNSTISDEDHVYLLGDVSFGTSYQTSLILEELNGKIHLILGNHDLKRKQFFRNHGRITSVEDYAEIEVGGVFVILFHYPIQEWNGSHYGSVHLHGHRHSKTPCEYSNNLRRADVGVDAWNFYPVEIEKVLETAIKNAQ